MSRIMGLRSIVLPGAYRCRPRYPWLRGNTHDNVCAIPLGKAIGLPPNIPPSPRWQM